MYFYFPWAAEKVAERPELFAKAQLPGKDLRAYRDIAEPLRVFGLLLAAFASIWWKMESRSAVAVVSDLGTMGDFSAKCFFFSNKD